MEGDTLVDRDRLGEVDGTGSGSPADERDQAGGRRDQAGAERDQSAERRDETAEQRDEVGAQRDEVGAQRDEAAERRDEAAKQRDEAGKRRDEAADRRDQAAARSEGVAGAERTDVFSRSALARREAASDRQRASQDRGAGAGERSQSELDRGAALADRGAGATERSRSELDRGAALVDRGASERDREHASHDGLTGAYLRGTGLVELKREIARAKRSDQPFVLAFVDVDYLKAINDSLGHAAGDRMLAEVANALRAKLRSHDLIIRWGGDEFICAPSGLNMADATKRLALVQAALAESPGPGSVTVGLAQLQPDDSLESLIARADAALYRQRQ